MLHSISKRWIAALIEHGYLEQAKRDWYIYAVERRLGYCVAAVWLVVVGLVFRAPLQTVLFFFSVVFLRARTGGWHASSAGTCQVLSFLTTVLVVWAVRTTPVYLIWPISLVVMPLCFAVVYFFAPVNHKNLHLTAQEIQANHTKSLWRLVLLCGCCITLNVLWAQSGLGLSIAAGITTASAGIMAAQFLKEDIPDEV